MDKKEFLEKLENELTGLPENEIEERLAFYEEMINDKIEDGVSEIEAIKSIGAPVDIANQIISETPFIKLAKNKLNKKRRSSIWKSILVWCGSPVWLSILVSVLAIILSIYVSGWAVLISLWASAFSFAVCAICAPVLAVILFITKNHASGILILSACLILAGLTIFSYYGFKWLTKKYVVITKKLVLCLKKSFMRKGGAK